MPKGSSLINEPNNHPYITVSNMNNNFEDLNTYQYVPTEIYSQIKNYIVDCDDLIISVAGTLGLVKKVPKCLDKANLTENANRISEIKIDIDYLQYYLNTKIIQNRILAVQTNNAQPKLALKEIRNFKINYPPIEEQKKVSKFLSLIDSKIQLLEKKHENYLNFKKYLMQQIFAQKLRFDFNDDWQDHTFKELLIEVNEKTTVNNQHEILSSTKEGIFTQKEYFANRNVASKDNTGYKILRKNQIVLSPQNLWMGNINVNTEFEIGIVSPSYKIYETTDLIEIDYFKHIIKLPRLIYEYKCASEQGASIVRRNLNKQLFDEITISIPSLKEQQKIGNMLTLIDKKITETSKQIDESKEFKKGLLQQMFV